MCELQPLSLAVHRHLGVEVANVDGGILVSIMRMLANQIGTHAWGDATSSCARLCHFESCTRPRLQRQLLSLRGRSVLCLKAFQIKEPYC